MPGPEPGVDKPEPEDRGRALQLRTGYSPDLLHTFRVRAKCLGITVTPDLTAEQSICGLTLERDLHLITAY